MSTVPFLGTLAEHPAGIFRTTFREGERCLVCAGAAPGAEGVIPESCLEFSTDSLRTRLSQEWGRLFPTWRPNPQGEGRHRHVFHAVCLSSLSQRRSPCPYDSSPMHVHENAMLSTLEKIKKEIRHHRAIWFGIGAVLGSVGGELLALYLGMSREQMHELELSAALVTGSAVLYWAR